MTDRDALIRRIAGAIARKTASAAPAAVLDEIETTHVLVERATLAETIDAALVEAGAVIQGDELSTLALFVAERFRPIAASDTTET